MSKLLIAALVALSVAKLEAELATGKYTVDELQAAIQQEQESGECRSTAIAALQNALEAAAPLVVCDGKSITTRAGIKVAGDEIKDGMLSAESVKELTEKGYIA